MQMTVGCIHEEKERERRRRYKQIKSSQKTNGSPDRLVTFTTMSVNSNQS